MSESCDTTNLKAPHVLCTTPGTGLVCLLVAVHVLSCHCFAVVWVAQIFLFYSCCVTFLHKLEIQNDSSVDMQMFYL